ncbi:uncharacterized protein BJ212DRAFT_294198 [Suillus subaureus]|uniref:Uncharacterized protein n=1 Tax=Suillus subaureus TaxID=48587 RepID=A0A9P7EMD7_9AGAM|nr:uncharacterized protein BJ212DRAFT_294198 [Suillus subaureus]KAG1825723.1 hypothetical protein BJ212DRAFT_294198 [Suillus subaureus]
MQHLFLQLRSSCLLHITGPRSPTFVPLVLLLAIIRIHQWSPNYIHPGIRTNVLLDSCHSSSLAYYSSPPDVLSSSSQSLIAFGVICVITNSCTIVTLNVCKLLSAMLTFALPSLHVSLAARIDTLFEVSPLGVACALPTVREYRHPALSDKFIAEISKLTLQAHQIVWPESAVVFSSQEEGSCIRRYAQGCPDICRQDCVREIHPSRSVKPWWISHEA